VLSGDLGKVKQLSANCINCPLCVTDAPEEDSLFEVFRQKNPDTWYDKLYNEMAFIPVDRFLREDFPGIFNTQTKQRLLGKPKFIIHDDETVKNIYYKNCMITPSEIKNAKLFEVFIKIVDPSSKTEGMDAAFAFIKTNHGYKFCGFSTIP
jgi:hypothetical protein